MAESNEVACGCIMAPLAAIVLIPYLFVLVPLRLILAIFFFPILWLMEGSDAWESTREFVIGELDEMLEDMFKK